MQRLVLSTHYKGRLVTLYENVFFFFRRSIYGNNAIVIPKRNILYLLIKEVLNPFYVFQIASVLLWFLDEYIYYAAAIVVMSAGGITTAVYQTKKVELDLKIKSDMFPNIVTFSE